MAFTTLNLGLTLTIPTVGTRNWGQTLLSTTWTKISQHGHTGSGDGNPIGTSGISDGAVTLPKIKNNIGLKPYVTPVVPLADTATLDWNNGSIQTLDLGSATNDVGLTLSNPAQGARYKVIVIQGATPRDIVWPIAVKWPQGQKPIVSQSDDAIDMIDLYYDGTSYLGTWNVDFTA